MSDKGYLKEKRENAIAKFLDGAIAFNELLKGKKKILGIFSVGNFLERNDRKIFKFLLATLDDHVIGDNPNEKVVVEIEKVFAMLEAKDVDGFVEYVSGLLADEINTPFEGLEKQIYVGILSAFSGIIEKAIDKAIAVAEKAEPSKQ